ncbi:MAG: FISUMP domain-containing protein, partial [Bacilli bacterium]|nr:FISUMP domain-containing protein [Bacilli bacterium]
DNVGNTTIARSNVFNLDNTGPVISGVTTNVTNITHDSFTITRGGNANDAHSGLATNPYIYQRSTDNSTWTNVCTNNTTNCNVSGLNGNTTYYYRICVNDILGNQSCTASKTTKTIYQIITITDARDGQTYKIVEIGTQWWFAENLKYTGNGCLNKAFNSSAPHDACRANGSEIHYQWGAAMNGSTTPGVQGLCPTGWHIPTDDEWKTLEGYVDSTYGVGNTVWNKVGDRGTDVGKKLKGTSARGTDDYGFNGLLSGYRDTSGSLYNVGLGGTWWSSSPSGSNAWRRYVLSSYAAVNRGEVTQGSGFSVRCVRD